MTRPKPDAVNPNTGHGHVFPRPDGLRARCGGAGICVECAKDLALKQATPERRPKPVVAPLGQQIIEARANVLLLRRQLRDAEAEVASLEAQAGIVRDLYPVGSGNDGGM